MAGEGAARSVCAGWMYALFGIYTNALPSAQQLQQHILATRTFAAFHHNLAWKRRRRQEETEIDKDTEEESSDYKMERSYLRSAVARLATRRSNRLASGTQCMFPHDFFFVRDYCG